MTNQATATGGRDGFREVNGELAGGGDDGDALDGGSFDDLLNGGKDKAGVGEGTPATVTVLDGAAGVPAMFARPLRENSAGPSTLRAGPFSENAEERPVRSCRPIYTTVPSPYTP